MPYYYISYILLGLRGGLELQSVLVDGRIGHKVGFLMLIHHCLYRGLGMEDAYNKEMQLIFAIKMSFTQADLALIAECIFERLGCTKACFFSEASLAADAHQAQYSPLKDLDSYPVEAKELSLELYSATSAVVVDIGARQTTGNNHPHTLYLLPHFLLERPPILSLFSLCLSLCVLSLRSISILSYRQISHP